MPLEVVFYESCLQGDDFSLKTHQQQRYFFYSELFFVSRYLGVCGLSLREVLLLQAGTAGPASVCASLVVIRLPPRGV